MLVLLHSATLDPVEIWEAPFPDVVARLAEPGSISRNERDALVVVRLQASGAAGLARKGVTCMSNYVLFQMWGPFRQSLIKGTSSMSNRPASACCHNLRTWKRKPTKRRRNGWSKAATDLTPIATIPEIFTRRLTISASSSTSS